MHHFNVFNLTRSNCLRNYLEKKIILFTAFKLKTLSFPVQFLVTVGTGKLWVPQNDVHAIISRPGSSWRQCGSLVLHEVWAASLSPSLVGPPATHITLPIGRRRNQWVNHLDNIILRHSLIDYYCRHINGKQGFNPGGPDYFYTTPHRHSQTWLGGGKSKHHHNNNKSNSTAISALTLLTFLFFLNLLQNCLREQMETMNPTVRKTTRSSNENKIEIKALFELFSRSWWWLPERHEKNA